MQHEMGIFVIAESGDNGDIRVGYKNKENTLCIPPVYYSRLNLPTGKVLINPDGEFKNGLAVVMNGDGKFGMINTNGSMVITPKYDSLSNVIINDLVFFRIGTVSGFMKIDECIVAEYQDCVGIRRKEAHIYTIEHDNGKNTEIDLSVL